VASLESQFGFNAIDLHGYGLDAKWCAFFRLAFFVFEPKISGVFLCQT
jgi:hypothetical protein